MSVDTSDYDGACDVYDVRMKRCAKDKKCHACREVIRRGDIYCDTRMLFDGEWDDVARCARCEAMYQVIAPELDSGEEPDRTLNCGHTWEERHGEPAPPEYQALAFMTPAEAQALFQRQPRAFIGPEEDSLARIRRLLEGRLAAAKDHEQKVVSQ